VHLCYNHFMRLLGIDYGTKNIGLAVGETDHGFAFPKTVLKNDDKLFSSINEICREEGIKIVILGESKNFKGEDNKVMKEILSFKTALEEKLGLQVIFEPEFMTSAEAEHLQGKNEMLDASAAALILKSYLDKKHD